MSEVHDTIIGCAARGQPASFAEDNDLAALPAYDDDTFWASRSIDGGWLAEFLTDPASSIHHRGVIVVGGRITGGLDLEAAELTRRLVLRCCQLGAHVIDLDEARTRLISLTGTHSGGFSAVDAYVAGGVFLDDGFRATGEVRLLGASIGGQLNCRGGMFTNPNGGDALSADQARITGGVFVNWGFRSTGEVRLLGASIGGVLNCSGGEFINPKRPVDLNPLALRRSPSPSPPRKRRSLAASSSTRGSKRPGKYA